MATLQGSIKNTTNSSSRKNAWGNMSYADLITQAIRSSPEGRLTLSQIYDWMVTNVPYFKDKGDSNSSAGWKNSIRHNLSLHNKFMRVQNEGTGKSSWWVLNPEINSPNSPNGQNGQRRRANSMDTNFKKIGKRKSNAETKLKHTAANANPRETRDKPRDMPTPALDIQNHLGGFNPNFDDSQLLSSIEADQLLMEADFPKELENFLLGSEANAQEILHGDFNFGVELSASVPVSSSFLPFHSSSSSNLSLSPLPPTLGGGCHEDFRPRAYSSNSTLLPSMYKHRKLTTTAPATSTLTPPPPVCSVPATMEMNNDVLLDFNAGFSPSAGILGNNDTRSPSQSLNEVLGMMEIGGQGEENFSGLNDQEMGYFPGYENSFNPSPMGLSDVKEEVVMPSEPQNDFQIDNFFNNNFFSGNGQEYPEGGRCRSQTFSGGFSYLFNNNTDN